MKKIFSFLAGGLCGALVGGVVTLLFTPSSGQDLISSAENRWNTALAEGRKAREETQRNLERQFEEATRGKPY